MTTNQNTFEEFYKQWIEQSQRLSQDPQIIRTMSENFVNLQKELCNLYGAKNSTTTHHDLSHDIFDAIIKLTNKISQLEERVISLENHIESARSQQQ